MPLLVSSKPALLIHVPNTTLRSCISTRLHKQVFKAEMPTRRSIRMNAPLTAWDSVAITYDESRVNLLGQGIEMNPKDRPPITDAGKHAWTSTESHLPEMEFRPKFDKAA